MLATFGVVLGVVLPLFTLAASHNFAGSRIVCLMILPLSLTHTKTIQKQENFVQNMQNTLVRTPRGI